MKNVRDLVWFLASMISAQCKKALRPSPVIIYEFVSWCWTYFQEPLHELFKEQWQLKAGTMQVDSWKRKKQHLLKSEKKLN